MSPPRGLAAAPDAAPAPEEALAHGGELDLPGGPDAALLLHGLTGSTFELHVLAARLQAAGLRVLAPVMAGHGGAPEGLRGVTWQDWVAVAEHALGRLAGARRTAVIGLSMGGLVACALAHAHPDRLAGLVALAPALELRFPGPLGAALGRVPLLRDRVFPKGGSDVGDAGMRRRNRGLAGVTPGAVAQLAALARHVDGLLPTVRVPALVVAGARDHTVTSAGVRRVAARLGGGAALEVLPRSAHLVGIDVERERCAALVLRFLAGLRPPVGPAGPGPGVPPGG